jgi:cofilin
MKLKKSAKFITYKIQGGNIVTDVRSEDGSFEDFIAAFPPNDCRYAIYDMNFTTTDGRPGNKLVMVAWYVLSLV